MKKIGEGLSCSTKSDVTGELAYIATLEDVIKLFDKAAGKICGEKGAGGPHASPDRRGQL